MQPVSCPLAGTRTPSVDYGSCESPTTEKKEEPLYWESNGSVLQLCVEVACEAGTKVFLLVTLVGSLAAASDSFMMCNREDTPALANYSEVLLCQYFKGFVFAFPAMATSVLLLLFGRDLLQKRFYYGLLKTGGVISFNENVPYKDPLFMAMVFDFFHCVGYTILHLTVMHREGQDSHLMRGYVPEVIDTSEIDSAVSAENIHPSVASSPTTAVTALAANLAVKGGMLLLLGGPRRIPKLGDFKKKGKGKGASDAQKTLMFQKYIASAMVLITTFLETFLLIIFLFFAYDITTTLVPMSEYFDSYEDKDEDPMEYLQSFQDNVAQGIVQHCPQLMSKADGDLQKAYASIVGKYLLHRHSIKNKRSVQHSAEAPPHEAPSPEESSEEIESLLAKRKTIGLIRSLWPAELLMRWDLRGDDARNFRRVWVGYTVLAICWLSQTIIVLLTQACWVIMRLWNKEFEQLIPLSIIMLHEACLVLTIVVFCQSLAPMFPPRLSGPDSDK